jgi:hypothetical protein
VAFGALLVTIGWVGSGFPPRTARTEPLSMRPRCRSNSPRAGVRRAALHAVAVRCRPAARGPKRPEHVLPDPQPIWRGNTCQGITDRNTTRMRVTMLRSGTGGSCRWSRWMRRLGISGLSRVQIASSIRGMTDRAKPRLGTREASESFEARS